MRHRDREKKLRQTRKEKERRRQRGRRGGGEREREQQQASYLVSIIEEGEVQVLVEEVAWRRLEAVDGAEEALNGKTIWERRKTRRNIRNATKREREREI